MSSPSCFGESEMKSKFVQVTSWASSEHHPDLTRGRWVMLGSPNIVTYILTGLWGPKVFLVNRFPFIKLEWSYAPSKTIVQRQLVVIELFYRLGLVPMVSLRLCLDKGF